MKEAARWIDHYRAFWEQQFASLERYLKASSPRGKKRPHPKKRKDRL